MKKCCTIQNVAVYLQQQIKTTHTMTREIFSRLVLMGVKMILDCTPISLAVAVLTQTNGLTPKESERLHKAILANIKRYA